MQVLLRRRPQGAPTPEDFEIVETPVPQPAEGEVLVRAGWISLDPYQRGRMSDGPSYAKPVALGSVMEAYAAGEVVASRDPRFRPGEMVLAAGHGWQQFAAVPAERLERVDPAEAPLSTSLGVLGMPGFTAWLGLEEIGRPKPGEIVVVSAASGAVGSVVGQIAKMRGCHVVGVAGGGAKCRYATEELGFDVCIDHRAADLGTALDAACLRGIDVYWENVGGAVQAAVFPRLANFGRVVMCGIIAQYNRARGPDVPLQPGPNLGAAVVKRLRIQGFIITDHWERYPAFRAQMSEWVRAGRVKYREDVVDGLRNAPAAFIGLLEGKNFGKLLVKVG
jgi:NADPH-dependent curcumin reductase CurA